MNDTFPHDTSGCAASTNTVRGCSGSVVGPSGSHYIIGPLQKTSGPRKKEKTAMSHFWDTHHTSKHSQRASRSPFSTSVYEQFGPEPGSWWIQQRGALRRRTMKARRQRGRKKYHKIRTLLFLHSRQSSKKQSTHRNSAHRLKACELVVLSIAEHSALGAMMSVIGGPEHALPPEVLMREIHL